MLVHINHPNFFWSLTAEDIAPLVGVKSLEIYNGIPGIMHNYGDEQRASTERIWDVILAKRLGELGLPVMYGLASDDAHDHLEYSRWHANPGRGWVVVDTKFLTPESIVGAIEQGRFYASTGVELKKISFDGKTLEVIIKSDTETDYTTQFIGTCKWYTSESKLVVDANGQEVRTTRIYSDDIGQVLAEVKGPVATYKLKGDELYVRAKVTSTKLKANPHVKGEFEVAWIQPVVPHKD